MPRVAMILNNPKLMVATTQAGLTSGTAVECQVTSARLTEVPKYVTLPATGCAGESQSPGLPGYQLDLAWLDDWGVATGLSKFAWDNSAKPVWWELTPDSVGAPTQKVTGNSYCAAGGIGGEFGTGNPATSTATWPCIAKPTVVSTVTAEADAEAEAPDAAAVAA